jgi:hypothetical protein
MPLGFVIGNGESRKGFDLRLLRGKGLIYGCNALYRDFEPDLLVAGDGPIIEEIRRNYNGNFYQIKIESYLELPINNPFIKIHIPPLKGTILNWYSGVAACYLMCLLNTNVSDIYLLGFDLSAKHRVNNMYKGTSCYADSDQHQQKNLNQKRHLESLRKLVFDVFPDKKFYRVGNTKDAFPDEWEGANVSFVDYSYLINLVST